MSDAGVTWNPRAAISFCDQLAAFHPDIGELLNLHMKENEELLSHLFMADLRQQLLDDPPYRADVVQFLEERFGDSPETILNIIGASFVENIDNRQELNLLLKDVQGTALRDDWERYFGPERQPQ